MMRRLLPCLAAAALAAGSVHAQVLQTQVSALPAAEVQQLAPQLVPFAGGDVNFQNLVNGLALGLPVMLTSPLGTGLTQVVSFTPTGTMTPRQIAQTLENARQVAIANGIANPTAQQLGVLLNGGTLPTAAGTTNVNSLIGTATPVNASVAGATAAAAGTTTAGSGTPPSPAQQLQSTPRFARSDSPLPRGISDSPGTSGAGAATTATAEPARATAAGGGTSAAVPAIRRDR